MAQTIVVFVPGITGTTLVDPTSTTLAWPNQVANLIENGQQDQIVPLLERSDLTAGTPLRGFDGVVVYENLILYFGLTLDYTYVTSNEALPSTAGNLLIGYGYDWRQPNETSAAGLNTLLGTIATTYPGANLWLVAHSMGGLVCRYLIESGEFASPSYTLSGLVTMATPHLGVPLALSAITGEINPNGLLNASIIETLVDFPQFTSAFEMLPEVAFITTDQEGLACSVYSQPVFNLLLAAPPDGFGAPEGSFAAAQRFAVMRNYNPTPDGRPDYYLVYGTDLPTVDSFLYTSSGSSPTAQLAQQTPTSADSGDGTVPAWSASNEGGWATARYAAANQTHGGIPNDETVLSQIGKWISGG
jgi:hypothetical protein